MFIVNSIWRLKEGGKLGFITSDSFMTLNTHTKLRKFLLNNCIIKEILLAPKNLFSDQKVSTNPVIIILTKCSGNKNIGKRERNLMRIVPRINSEEDYLKPPIINEIPQYKYYSLPFTIFYVDIEDKVIELFEKAPTLENYLKGYIGMHTHNNRKFIAAIDGTELAKLFERKNKKHISQETKLKIISEEEFNTEKWKPYLKRGGGDQYYRPMMEALNWDDKAISIYDIPKNVPFEQEGIAISGISSRLAARYMPKGCYWDSNKAIGFIVTNKSVSIFYMLGLLNSSFYNYLAKGIINNTNSIQITGIHALPIIQPDKEIKNAVEKLVNNIIENLKNNLKYDYTSVQKHIDNIIYKFYDDKFNFPENLKRKLEERFSCYALV